MILISFDMNFTLRQLETFIWVATLCNFRKTAKHLHTTQPAISIRISGLEDILGVKLFERNTGSVRLTARGQKLLPYAKKILKMAELLNENSDNSSAMSGMLRLGVSETIVHTLLPEFLTELHNRYPNIDIEITVDVTDKLRNELVARALDLAFLMGPVSEYRIENLELGRLPLVWAASPQLGIDTRKPLKIDDLAQYPLLTFARNTRSFAEIEIYLHANCEALGRIFPSNSLAALLQMTIDGIGIGILPRALLKEKLHDGSLTLVPCDWTPSDLVFTASFPSVPSDPICEAAAKLAHEIALK